jgi:hypothetical protein
VFTTDRRLLLHQLLKGFTQNVYFQPPDGVVLKYPAIIYELDDIKPEFAGNVPYRLTNRYQLTIIDPMPDSPIPIKVAVLPTCRFDRFFVADNLNHFVFNLYF